MSNYVRQLEERVKSKEATIKSNEEQISVKNRIIAGYETALEDLAVRIGVRENYLVEEFSPGYFDYEPVTAPWGSLQRQPVWVEGKKTGKKIFNTAQFVSDLSHVAKSTGASERLTPPAPSDTVEPTKKKKEANNNG